MTDEIDFRNKSGGVIKKVLWSTDLHFDAADRDRYKLYCDLVVSHEVDAVLIGGDISNGGGSSLAYLKSLSKEISKPIYFVLGNHDYYYGSIEDIRLTAHELCKEVKSLTYLTGSGLHELTETTCLIGHDGWADGRAGDYQNSDVLLNDYFLIQELNQLNPKERLEKLNEFGNQAAAYLKSQLELGAKRYKNMILLTHVPPFEEACLYEGQPASDDWLPHFVSLSTGNALKEVMKKFPDQQLLVLCGHSHWGQDIHILPNLQVVTGHSELGLPNVQGLILIN